jgi:hypothetical protein
VFPKSAKKVLVRQKEKGKTVHEEKEKVEEIPHGMCCVQHVNRVGTARRTKVPLVKEPAAVEGSGGNSGMKVRDQPERMEQRFKEEKSRKRLEVWLRSGWPKDVGEQRLFEFTFEDGSRCGRSWMDHKALRHRLRGLGCRSAIPVLPL